MWGKRAAAVVLALGLAGPAMAWESLDFALVGQEDDALVEALRGASLLVDLQSREVVAPPDIVSAAQGDYARMVETLYALGHYSAVVTIRIDGREAAAISPLSVPERIGQVVVTVEPRARFTFGRAEIAPLANGRDRPEAFRRGAPALATVVRDAASGAIDGWRREGHAKADLAGQEIAARHPEAELDVTVRVDPGPRLSFGDVLVTSQSAVKAPRIRQIAGIPRGETFDPRAVEDAAERLRATGTFRSVQITEAETVNPDASMDIFIEVTDRKPRRFGAGVEVSSNEGLTLSGFWLHRNFLGGAERFRIDGEARQLGGSGDMQTDYQISARLERPAVYGPDTLAYLFTDLEFEDEPDYIARKFEIGIGASREFSDQVTGDLGISYMRSRVTDLYLPGDPTRLLSVLSLPASLTLDRRDNPLDPTEGFFLRVEARPFVMLNAEEAGGRVSLDTRGYRAFGAEEGVVLAGRLQLGALVGPEAADAPPNYLYYSGGGGSVRGQPYKSLDAEYDGRRLGGRSFLALSTEVRVDVTEKIGVVAFADTGYIGGESLYDGSGAWHSGAGLGLRYDTPVGPIRFDVAGPVQGDTGDGVQIYIGIGQAF
jgi:translocation and assembly module TamA